MAQVGRRRIIRRWQVAVVEVVTVGSRQGEQVRGRIRLVAVSGGWQCAWQVVDHEGVELAAQLRGDYLDAEAVLLGGETDGGR